MKMLHSITKLEIFDTAGNKVRATSDVRHATYIWDGRDNHGNCLNNGAYLVKVQDGMNVYVEKLTLLR